MDNRSKALGLGLIFLGIIFLLENLNVITFNFFLIWPVFVILGGVGFLLGFFINKKNYGLVMPGIILIIYGSLFMYCNIMGWEYMQSLWPVFLLGPGLGFFVLYFAGQKDKGLLLPGGILTVLGLLFIFRYFEYLRYWPVLLIIGGIVLIFLSGKKNNTQD
jgi:hypothetical protein